MLRGFAHRQIKPLVNLRLRRPFTVLGLESSADDTCAAVVTSDRRILSNVVGKQNALHEPFGGIEPIVAIKAHHALMPGVVRQALSEAGMTMEDIDGVAYTRGPGMLGCLRTCSVAARTLAAVHNKPIVGVHHMQAHALTPLLTSPSTSLPQFPFLTLLISGGHTLMLLSTSSTQHRIIAGQNVDLSIGRAFDKAAKLLHIPWGSKGPGAALEAFAATAPTPSSEDPKYTVPALGRIHFSYAGLLSQVDRAVTGAGGIDGLSIPQRAIVARAFQQAAFAQLSDKILLFMKESDRQGHEPICDVVISGGVASNTHMRQRFSAVFHELRPEVKLHYPPPALCTDNAAMIAWASMERFLAGDTDTDDLEIRAQWSIEDVEDIKISPS